MSVEATWVLITIAVAVVTGAVGYLLGQADGLREGWTGECCLICRQPLRDIHDHGVRVLPGPTSPRPAPPPSPPRPQP